MQALPFPMWPSLMSTRMRDDFGSRRGGLPAKMHGKLNTYLHIFLCGLGTLVWTGRPSSRAVPSVLKVNVHGCIRQGADARQRGAFQIEVDRR